MSTTFRRGQETGKSGLTIFLKSKDGSPKNAAEIYYDIFDFTTGVEVLLAPAHRQPVNSTVGEYFANFFIPLDANCGDYRIRWYFKEYQNSQTAQVLQEWSVIDNTTQITNLPGATPVEYDLVKSLRILLRDNNPGRNYHFMPPSGAETLSKYNRVFGFIWEDAELLEFLKISVDAINMHPPQTFFHTIDQMMIQARNWRTVMLTGGMVHALTALTANMVAEEFDYSIGGVSLNIDKSSKYQSLSNDVNTRFNEYVLAAKETVKIIRGLKQSRYGIGIRSSFGPSVGRGSLTPRRFIGV